MGKAKTKEPVKAKEPRKAKEPVKAKEPRKAKESVKAKEPRITEHAHAARASKLLEGILSLPGEKAGILDRVELLLTNARAAGERYKKEHWGRTGTRGLVETKTADPRADEVFPVMGELYSVTYKTKKGADTDPDLYEHKFGRPRPLLLYAPKQGGLLLIGGGRYRVTERGIEG
jgi:hypothetical protein